MSTLATQVRARRLTAEFLQSLRARGLVLGVDDHQRVQELLLRLPADTQDATLGNALVALFATTPEEQDALRKTFATSLALTNQILAPAAAPDPKPDIAPPTADEVKQDARDRRKLLWAGLPLLLVLLAAVAHYLQPRTYTFDSPRTLTLTVGEERALPGMDTVRATIGNLQSFENIEFPPPTRGAISLREGKLYYRAGDLARLDSARLLILGTWNRSAKVTFRFRLDTLVAATPDTQTVVESKLKQAEIDFSPLPLPYPRSLADLAPKPDTTTTLDRFLYQWWWPLVGLFFIGCLVFLFFLLRYLHRRKQRLVARRDRLAGAPHFWRIRVPDATTGVDFGETYPLLLRQLRQRREADHRVLDVAGTIDATIESGGMPTFAYKGTSRPAEYLLLIDRGGADNHRAQLFELLYQRLRSEEVLIERYFYDGDPRLLYQDDRSAGTTLPRLRDRLPNTQLVLVGTGDQLLNATNGKPAAWATKQLAAWGRPSLLTPRPHNDWGRRERRLDELLNILPATIQGLGLLTSRLTSTDNPTAGLTDYRPLLEDLVQEPVHFSGDLISSLREVYDEAQLKWIAACALYPSLHWELTLFFGQTISELNSTVDLAASNASNVSPLPRRGAGGEGESEVGTALLSSRNVLELCRLPWFVQGAIPEPARVVLTEWLRENHPTNERKLRAALLLALNQAEPPENSVADQELTFQRLQNEWMLAAPNSPERARAADQIAEAIEAGGVPDATVVKYLNEPLGRFDIPLDDKWKKRLYPGGLPGLGWRKSVRQLLLIASLLLIFCIAGSWLPSLSPTIIAENLIPVDLSKEIELQAEVLTKQQETIEDQLASVETNAKTELIDLRRSGNATAAQLRAQREKIAALEEEARRAKQSVLREESLLIEESLGSKAPYSPPPTGQGFNVFQSSVYFIYVDRVSVTHPESGAQVIELDDEASLKWSGTGFLTTDSRLITARHVIQGWRFQPGCSPLGMINALETTGGKVNVTYRAVSSDGSEFTFTEKNVNYSDAEDYYSEEECSDIGKLQVVDLRKKYTDWAYVDLGGQRKGNIVYNRELSRQLKQQEQLHVMGYNFGLTMQSGGVKDLDPLYSTCTVAQNSNKGKMINVTNISYGSGCSGGPVFAVRYGKAYAVGIVSYQGDGANGQIVSISNMY